LGFVLRFLMTFSHQMRKHLRCRDQTIDIVPPVVPFG
jgi:hypothetical protein